MKYKKLSKEQLIISFDRLTRFKNTKDKYFRVFSEILLSCLTEPVYKKNDLIKLPKTNFTAVVSEIINASLADFCESSSKITDFSINDLIKLYENSVFVNDEETQEYLSNDIRYDLFKELIDESCPINLRWLKSLEKGADMKSKRYERGLKFPIEKVVLAEGITEEILLPAFSKYLGFDFYRNGIQIIPAGGKNQVVKMYYRLSDELKIPIFLLLDKDAEDNISQIKPRLRDIDRIHLVSCGEFEDLLPKSLIIKTINNELANFDCISEADFADTESNAKALEQIFKTKGQHEFKKSDFAKLVKDNITLDTDISPEIAEIIMEIGL